jgi:hypothetical protein
VIEGNGENEEVARVLFDVADGPAARGPHVLNTKARRSHEGHEEAEESNWRQVVRRGCEGLRSLFLTRRRGERKGAERQSNRRKRRKRRKAVDWFEGAAGRGPDVLNTKARRGHKEHEEAEESN